MELSQGCKMLGTLPKWQIAYAAVLYKNNMSINKTHHLLFLVWHAPLGVRSAKRRHQSPEWTILSHSYRLIQW